MKNVNTVVLAAALKNNIEICKNLDLHHSINLFVKKEGLVYSKIMDSSCGEYIYIRDETFSCVFKLTYEDGEYKGARYDAVKGKIYPKIFASEDYKVLILGLLTYFKLSL